MNVVQAFLYGTAMLLILDYAQCRSLQKEIDEISDIERLLRTILEQRSNSGKDLTQGNENKGKNEGVKKEGKADKIKNKNNGGKSLDKEVLPNYLEKFVSSMLVFENKKKIKAKGVKGKKNEDKFLLNDQVPKEKNKKRNLLSLNSVWPNAIVPYTTSLENASLAVLEEAKEIMSNLTCVRFRELYTDIQPNEVGHDNYVDILSSSGCWSYLGMINHGEQQLSLLEPACISVRTALHEMMHTLGITHEQSRSDRDEYVKILEDNVGSNTYYVNQFPTINYSPYDFQSIMHYSLYRYDKKLIAALDERLEFLVHYDTPTLPYYDVMKTNKIYDCSRNCSDNPICENGSFKNHMCECYCPEWLKGETCNEIEYTDTGCGGIYTLSPGEEIEITTPNYPQNYSVGSVCRWLFKTEPGWHLRADIEDLRLAYNSYLYRCYHYLEIRFNLIGQTGLKICGDSGRFSITTSKDSMNLLMIEFNSHFASDRDPQKGARFIVYTVGTYCLSNPCIFGRCIETEYSGCGFSCQCQPGFSGHHCDTVNDNGTLICPFTNHDTCFMENTDSDDFDWTITKGGLNPETGPQHAAFGNQYLLAEMQAPRTAGDVARLVMDVNLPDQERCLSFYYNMNGEYVDTLTVYSNATNNTLWSKTGHQGLSWHIAKIDIPIVEEEIVIQAVRGTDYRSEIAIDEIELTPGQCKDVTRDTVPLRTSQGQKLYLSDYGFTFEEVSWINFEVQGCYDAFIFLMVADRNLSLSYDIKLGRGSNSWSSMEKMNFGQKSLYTTDGNPVMDCNSYSPFWIGWDDGKFQVGTGLDYGENVIMSNADVNPYNISFVAISQYQADPIYWKFRQGNCFPSLFQCTSGNRCINKDFQCDNVPDCADESDEENCIYPNCSINEFRCTYGRCISNTLHCNGQYECLDHSDEEGCHVSLMTSQGQKLYLSDYGYTFEEVSWINFEVQGCYDAFIFLMVADRNFSLSYNIKLGRGNNSWSSMEKMNFGQKSLYTTDGNPVMDCNSYSPFWIGWDDGKFQVGTGLDYGENVIMSNADVNPYNISFVAISQYHADPIYWNFRQGNCFPSLFQCASGNICINKDFQCNNIPDCADESDEENCVYPNCSINEFRCTYGRCISNTLHCNGQHECSDQSDEEGCPIHVPPKYLTFISVDLNIANRSSLLFTVKACADAWILMTESSGNEAMYKIGLGRGSNTFSSLTAQGTSSSNGLDNILDCTAFEPFWIFWNNTDFQVGQGNTVGNAVLLSWKGAATGNLDSLSVSTWSVEAYFDFWPDV